MLRGIISALHHVPLHMDGTSLLPVPVLRLK